MDFSIFAFGHAINVNRAVSQKIKYRMTKSVDPDETARYEPSHLNLHCLQGYLFWSTMLKGLWVKLETQWLHLRNIFGKGNIDLCFYFFYCTMVIILDSHVFCLFVFCVFVFVFVFCCCCCCCCCFFFFFFFFVLFFFFFFFFFFVLFFCFVFFLFLWCFTDWVREPLCELNNHFAVSQR